ncbi:MAG: hypothetical protein HY815_10185 [Candidatus Riflebacteria bacterium]|nr:hypothetical protein [Candidatus Riflebacteria bacterium]
MKRPLRRMANGLFVALLFSLPTLGGCRARGVSLPDKRVPSGPHAGLTVAGPGRRDTGRPVKPRSLRPVFPPAIFGRDEVVTRPPVAILPPPRALRADVRRIVQRFGLWGIAGSGTSAEGLAKLERAYARFPRRLLRNLHVVFEPQERTIYTGRELLGAWVGVERNGAEDSRGTRDLSVAMAAGRIYHFQDARELATHVLAHEAGHHATIFAEPGWGRALVESLGWRLRKSYGASDPGRFMRVARYSAERVPRSSFITRYARTNQKEHVAELIMHHLCTREEEAGGFPPRPGFALRSGPAGLLARMLGPAQADS